jgi:Skp family chaperone for outer membrane proteins
MYPKSLITKGSVIFMKKMCISCAALVSCVAGSLLADPVIVTGKVGYISSAEVINSSKIGKETREKLDSAFKKSGAEVTAEEQKVTVAINSYKGKEAAMSDSAREAEQAKLMKMRRDFDALVQEKDEEIKRLQAKLNEQLTKEALNAAETLAKTKNLEAVIDIDSGKVMYAASNVNYTKEFTACIDKNYDSKNNTKVASAKTVAKPAAGVKA